MANDKRKTGKGGGGHINVEEAHEVQGWTKKFGCTEAQLRAAVKAVGPTAKNVESHLKDRDPTSEPAP